MDVYTITLSELVWHFRYIIILCNEELSTIIPKFGSQSNVFRALWETLNLALLKCNDQYNDRSVVKYNDQW